jgi:outer membrane protein assembly factor BamB
MKTSCLLQTKSVIVLFFLFATYLGELDAQDTTWPQFRGHHSSGIAADDAKPPVQFGPNQNFLWKVALPVGHSSPCIWNDKIFLTGFIEDQKELHTICINRKTGEITWRQAIHPEKIEAYHAISNAATATPTTDGVRVYVYFGSYGIVCYDMSGVLLWEKQIPLTDIDYGASTSPIATKDVLILSHDFQDDSYLLALDKATGDSVWKAMLPKVGKFPNTTSYSTPLLKNNQVILHRTWEISAYSVIDGSRLWWLPTATSGISTPIFHQNTLYIGTWQELGEKERRTDFPNFTTMLSKSDNNSDGLISQEEIPEDMVLFSRPEMLEIEMTTHYVKDSYEMFDINEDGAINKEEWDKTIEWIASYYEDSGLIALRPNASGELPISQMLWKEKEKVPEVPTPIFYNGCVYMIKNGGIITCVDAASGKVLYRERLGASGPYIASPIVANGNIYIPSGKGVITVIKAGNQLEILAQNKLKEKIFASPAVIGNTLYVRTTKHLFAFGSTDYTN